MVLYRIRSGLSSDRHYAGREGERSPGGGPGLKRGLDLGRRATMIRYYTTLLWILFVLATLSLVVGVIAKATGFVVFGLIPLSYLRFTGICLLFAIALSVVEISLKMGR